MEIEKIAAKPHIITGKPRVAAYARVSAEKEAAHHSLSAQVSYYNSYIANRTDWIFAGIFADYATTGTKADRPELQRLLSACRNHEVDLVITKSITRLSRNTVATLEIIRELKALGISIYFEKENINTLSADGELMLTLLAAFAQAEAQSASENQIWRIRKRFEQGIPNGCNVYGYRYLKGQFVIMPKEAAVVRQIFRYYLSGLGFARIAKKLMQDNIPCKRGELWRESTLHDMLCNEVYIGSLLLQKTYRKDYLSKQQMKNHGELKKFHVYDAHEAIVNKEVFDAVQKEMARRRNHIHTSQTGKESYPFTNLLRCGVCGKSYRHKTTAIGTKYEKAVWICGTFNTYGKEYCASQQIPENILTAKTCEVLHLPSLEVVNLREYLREIIVVSNNLLRYVLSDGNTVDVKWENPSRSKSWTPEMKQLAAERQRQFARKRKEAMSHED